jgi:hypothetical protein
MTTIMFPSEIGNDEVSLSFFLLPIPLCCGFLGFCPTLEGAILEFLVALRVLPRRSRVRRVRRMMFLFFSVLMLYENPEVAYAVHLCLSDHVFGNLSVDTGFRYLLRFSTVVFLYMVSGVFV